MRVHIVSDRCRARGRAHACTGRDVDAARRRRIVDGRADCYRSLPRPQPDGQPRTRFGHRDDDPTARSGRRLRLAVDGPCRGPSTGADRSGPRCGPIGRHADAGRRRHGEGARSAGSIPAARRCRALDAGRGGPAARGSGRGRVHRHRLHGRSGPAARGPGRRDRPHDRADPPRTVVVRPARGRLGDRPSRTRDDACEQEDGRRRPPRHAHRRGPEGCHPDRLSRVGLFRQATARTGR